MTSSPCSGLGFREVLKMSWVTGFGVGVQNFVA